MGTFSPFMPVSTFEATDFLHLIM